MQSLKSGCPSTRTCRRPWPSSNMNPCASYASCRLNPPPLSCHRNSPTSPTAKQRHSPLPVMPKCLHKNLKESESVSATGCITPSTGPFYSGPDGHDTHGQDNTCREGPRPYQQIWSNQVTPQTRQDIGLKPSDRHYHHLQRQHPWTRHQMCKPHVLFAASVSRLAIHLRSDLTI